MVFTSVIIIVMISLYLHHNPDYPDFSHLEFFSPRYYYYFLLLLISSSVFFGTTSSSLRFLIQVPTLSCPLPNNIFCILWHNH